MPLFCLSIVTVVIYKCRLLWDQWKGTIRTKLSKISSLIPKPKKSTDIPLSEISTSASRRKISSKDNSSPVQNTSLEQDSSIRQQNLENPVPSTSFAKDPEVLQDSSSTSQETIHPPKQQINNWIQSSQNPSPSLASIQLNNKLHNPEVSTSKHVLLIVIVNSINFLPSLFPIIGESFGLLEMMSKLRIQKLVLGSSVLCYSYFNNKRLRKFVFNFYRDMFQNQ